MRSEGKQGGRARGELRADVRSAASSGGGGAAAAAVVTYSGCMVLRSSSGDSLSEEGVEGWRRWCWPGGRRRGPCPTARNLLWSRQPRKVLLYPEEGWARSAMSSHWILAPCWWSRSRCKVTEVTGNRRFKTQAKIINSGHSITIVGSFKKVMTDPEFKGFLEGLNSHELVIYNVLKFKRIGIKGFMILLNLTCNVTMEDFNMGYLMTGSLERGQKMINFYQVTHFAIIQRIDFTNS